MDRVRFALILLVLSVLALAACSQPPTPSPMATAESAPTTTPATLTPTHVPSPPPYPTLSPRELAALPVAPPAAYPRWYVALTSDDDWVEALPYCMPDGSCSVALLDHLEHPGTVSWDLRDDPLAAGYTWKDLRQLFRAPETNRLSFLGLDDRNRWWIGVVVPASRSAGRPAKMVALLPIGNPEEVSYDYTWESNLAFAEYYIVENRVLRVYRWTNNAPALVYEMENTPTNAVSPWKDDLDMNGDGQADVTLRWYEWGTKWAEATIKYQFLGPANTGGYRSLGSVDRDFQYTDANSDGVGEFLYPRPATNPTQWDVVAWNGTAFTATAPILRPAAPPVQQVDVDNLPPLPADLYLRRDDKSWRWPREGGALQQVDNLPAAPASPCPAVGGNEKLFDWSPSCRYALAEMRGMEGGSTGFYDTQSSQTVEIPGSFVYASGWSSFAWDPQERFLVHAGADGCVCLYRIDLPGGQATALLHVVDVFDFMRRDSGAVDPFVFPDGSIGLSIQGLDPSRYPIFGVYRLMPEGTLVLLAQAPPLALRKQEVRATLGQVLWSPGGAAYLYQVPLTRSQPLPDRPMLLGLSDGSAVYELSDILDGAKDFQWGQ